MPTSQNQVVDNLMEGSTPCEPLTISQINHNIKHRKKPNDVFITPLPLAKNHIKIVDGYCNRENAVWLDPCKNSGNYYNNFNKKNKVYCEILENKDFFKYNKNVDVICSNPPFSLIYRWLKKSVDLKPEVISYLVPFHALTPKRVQQMENAGYCLVDIHQFKWVILFGMCAFITWKKTDIRVGVNFTVNRTVWYIVPVWEEKKLNAKKRILKKIFSEWKKLVDMKKKAIKRRSLLKKKIPKLAAKKGRQNMRRRMKLEAYEAYVSQNSLLILNFWSRRAFEP
jgi:hypothetical protein